MLEELDQILEGLRWFCTPGCLRESQRNVGDQVLSSRGFTRNLEVLQHNLSNVQGSLHSVRSYAQMLKADIEKADHRGWIDARKENVSELKDSLPTIKNYRRSTQTTLTAFSRISRLSRNHRPTRP